MKNDYTESSATFTRNKLREMIARFVPSSKVPGKINIVTDTSNFIRVEYDDVVILDDHPYLIRNNKCEGRFGIDDQPKYWVKSAKDLISGETKIIKMVFHEKITSTIGELTFERFRSPKKEARVLALVNDHPSFMHGSSTRDSAGNIIRVLNFIPGKTIGDHIQDLGHNHEDYFYNHFQTMLDDYIQLVEAIGFLHDHGEKHGDIRRDHIIRDRDSGLCRWIDFDYNYMHKANISTFDLFGLGNVLVFLAGRGDVTTQDLKRNNREAFDSLKKEDVNMVFLNRVVNLKKIYHYIPDSLNDILLRFSTGANIFYDNVPQLINDLEKTRKDLSHGK